MRCSWHSRCERSSARNCARSAASGSSPCISTKAQSRKSAFSASSSMGYPRYSSSPFSPSMKVTCSATWRRRRSAAHDAAKPWAPHRGRAARCGAEAGVIRAHACARACERRAAPAQLRKAGAHPCRAAGGARPGTARPLRRSAPAATPRGRQAGAAWRSACLRRTPSRRHTAQGARRESSSAQPRRVPARQREGPPGTALRSRPACRCVPALRTSPPQPVRARHPFRARAFP